MIINLVISNQRLFSQVLYKEARLENILYFVYRYTLSRSTGAVMYRFNNTNHVLFYTIRLSFDVNGVASGLSPPEVYHAIPLPSLSRYHTSVGVAMLDNGSCLI